MSINNLPAEQDVMFIERPKASARAAQLEYLARQKAFWEWWKKGVVLAGYQYFGDGTKQGFENASEKNHLRPMSEKIEKAIGLAGNSEVIFLSAMYCFYNDFTGAKLCEKAGVKSIGDMTGLDTARREVIAGLLITYCGW